MTALHDAIAPPAVADLAIPVAFPGARPVQLERVVNPCALCGRTDGTELFPVDGSLIVRCDRCGLVREATRPTATSAVYDADYYSTESSKGGYANYVLDAGINRLTFAERLRAIEAKLGRGPRRRGANARFGPRLLDVGCALGDFVEVAREEGWDAEGVEISSFAAAEGRRRGLTIHCGILEDLGLEAGSYDVITLYDVIEHLIDPVRTMREVARLLASGGVVHIVTPNVGGLQAKVLGAKWYHYKPGEHLYLFSPSTIRRTIDRTRLTWLGWGRSGSYVTLTYVFSRLRYYAPRAFGALEAIGRTVRFGPVPFKLYVGEMEVWARRPALRVLPGTVRA
jgi:2-polyprenyl-3-methyl-5-hydroxy-6-metoxy-1,4-benzoquinol methylase